MRRFHIGSVEWAPPRIPVHLPLGEGSLGWLLYLVQRGRLDLLEVALAPIADACLEYWRECADLDEGGDAVAAIAYLTERKAERLLAPAPEPEPEEDLSPLTLPDEFRSATEHLKALEKHRSLFFFRRADPNAEDYELPLPFGEIESERLLQVLQRLLERALPTPEPIPERPRFSLRLRMVEILHALQAAEHPLPFEATLPENFTRLDVVLHFLALLELVRLRQVKVQVREENGTGIVLQVGLDKTGQNAL